MTLITTITVPINIRNIPAGMLSLFSDMIPTPNMNAITAIKTSTISTVMRYLTVFGIFLLLLASILPSRRSSNISSMIDSIRLTPSYPLQQLWNSPLLDNYLQNYFIFSFRRSLQNKRKYYHDYSKQSIKNTADFCDLQICIRRCVCIIRFP